MALPMRHPQPPQAPPQRRTRPPGPRITPTHGGPTRPRNPCPKGPATSAAAGPATHQAPASPSTPIFTPHAHRPSIETRAPRTHPWPPTHCCRPARARSPTG
jgi:hypothetical protein